MIDDLILLLCLALPRDRCVDAEDVAVEVIAMDKAFLLLVLADAWEKPRLRPAVILVDAVHPDLALMQLGDKVIDSSGQLFLRLHLAGDQYSVFPERDHAIRTPIAVARVHDVRDVHVFQRVVYGME